MLKLKNLRSQSLTKSQDGTATELIEIYLLAHILTYLIVRLNLARLSKCYFLIFVLYFTVSNNNTIATLISINPPETDSSRHPGHGAAAHRKPALKCSHASRPPHR